MQMHLLMPVGRQGFAGRSRVGVRGARRTRRGRVCMGRRVTPGGRHRANTWQGNFPRENRCDDGFDRTSPVVAFPPNGYGIYDMIGNVWEWTSDWFSPVHESEAKKTCCIPENPRSGHEEDSFDPRQPEIKIPRRIIKGRLPSARQTTAAVTARPPAMRSRWILPPAIWASDVSRDPKGEPQCLVSLAQ